ncbi:hypothetical protein K432DRAFT_426137 [Lepidopterella palustris CBS 459.81]|uniref:DNA replication factor Cdt1 C-terminal domain-containing protein n=1 Tax=Lepidopterella palustris CBS 459.81 TaxID=1314670 RepID=A0A8E2E9W7_9PEZI|nr:hypothetical protein K432DRAFT_426137 [Lepidopterella palustris CBS 459.81]
MLSPTNTRLPIELNDLVTLHSSFLTALSLHYAHNGIATPVDLRVLAPSVASVWGRRKVTLDDIRICIGVMDRAAEELRQQQPFRLSDYGQGKICLEMSEQAQSRGIMARHVDENTLNEAFVDGLENLWRAQIGNKNIYQADQVHEVRPIMPSRKRGRPRKVLGLAKAQATTTNMTTFQLTPNPSMLLKFIAGLPRGEIEVCSSLAKVAPLREKGRKRLQDLKDDAEQARAQKKSRYTTGKENQPTQTKITEFATTRKTNLLDRILAKQAFQASLPNPPTPAELERMAALQRAEEVLSVLSLLAAGKGMGQRVSFSIATLVQALQGSVRSPISKDEAVRCIEVLAEEVSPGYIGLLRMGGMCSVVVNPAARPLDLRNRLLALGVE